ncbi:MAG: caspase family protein [Ignavibacteriaceae bacterium]|nr:caspase family protein [Ignavibacteriaceae bacterium]
MRSLHPVALLLKVLLFMAAILPSFQKVSAQEGMPELVPQSGHAPAVSALAPFKDIYILSGDLLGNVILWNAETGRQIRNFSGHNRKIKKIAASPDGETIAALSEDGSVVVWKALSGERVRLINTAELADFAFAGDTSLILATAERQVYSISITGPEKPMKHLFSYVRLNSSERTLISSVFSVKDSTWFLITQPGFGSKVYQLAVSNFLNFSGKRTYDINDGIPGGLAISADERYAGLSLNGNIHIFDAAKGRLLTTIETGNDTIYRFEFSADGVYLAVQQNDSSAGIWNQITQKSAGVVTAPGRFLTSLMISPDRKYVYTGSGNGEIFQFDFKSRRKTREFKSNLRYLTAMDFFGKENNLVTGSLIQGVNIFRSDGRVTEIPTDSEGFLYTLASPDEKTIAGINEKRIVLWEAETGREISRTDKPPGMVNSAVFSPDGSVVYIALPDSSLLIYSTAKKEFTKQKGFAGEIFNVSVSPDGNKLALADRWYSFTVYSTETYDSLFSLGAHGSVIYSSAWSPDGELIATTAEDSCVYIWNGRTGGLIRKITTDYQVVTDVRFSPDGTKLGVAAVGGAVYLYETSEWKLLHRHDNTGVYIAFIAFSSDSRLIAGTTATGQLRIWNTLTGKEEFSVSGFNKTDWAVTLPDGRFDASQEGMKLLHFVKGYDVIPLESFFNENYYPSISGEALRGSLIPLRDEEIKEKFLFKLPPDIKITSPKRGAKLKSGKNLIDIETVDRGGGIRWVRLFVNDKLAAEQEFSSRAAKEGDTLSLVFETELLPDTNRITVVAASLNGIESMPATESWHVQGSRPRSKLYIVGIGVNEYINPAYDLKNAVSDIRILSEKFKEGTSGFTAGVSERLIFNSDASREEILSALDSVAALARPQDIFLLLYSGHGVFSAGKSGEGDFYFVLHDMENMYTSDSASLARGISASELREYSKRISANKQLLIIDACQAGGAVEVFAMRGVAEEKAIQSLARSSGMFLLASSARNSAAKELPALGMGIYSYALSEALNCMGDFDKDGVLLVKEMEFYARRKLEEVQKKYKLTPQYPMSWMMYQDFPVSVCK